MSYLMDAIRKAEKQRHNDSIPTLEGLVSERRARTSRSPRGWLIWIMLMVVIALSIYLNQALVARWWDRAGETVSQVADRVSGPSQSETVVQPTLSQPRSDEATTASTLATPATIPPTNSVLTDTQRALIGQIKLTVVSYSTDENKRFIMVGSEVLREGDQLEGFEITRIQQDGVVIEVNGAGVLVRP